MTRADAATFNDLINKIKLTPLDDKKKTNDSVKLTAETAAGC
jgi:lipopolysaccharide biosynthesis protein WzzE